ncbi:hypothetical protein Tco_0674897 [Tanacetum coccineum]
MSTHEQQTTIHPTSAVRNTGGRNGPQGLEEPMSDEVLRGKCAVKKLSPYFCRSSPKDAKRQEQKDKLNAVKARPIYGDESGIKIVGKKGSQLPCDVPVVATKSTKQKERSKRKKEEPRRHQQKGTLSRTTSRYSESKDSEGGHWKSKSRRHMSNTYEDDLSQPWTCVERNPFTHRIRHFSLPMTRMPSHVKTYDGSGDPEDHLKLFQSAAKTGRHGQCLHGATMFNSSLTAEC